MRRLFVTILMLSTLAILPACSSGGGGGVVILPKKTAIVKISSSGSLPLGTQIGGVDVTLDLPAGLSVKATPDTENSAVLVTDSRVVTVSGVAAGTNSMAMGTYTTNTNHVSLHLMNADGFGTGEFVQVKCNIASGATVTTGSMTAPSLSAVDLNGAPISGLTAGATVQVQ